MRRTSWIVVVMATAVATCAMYGFAQVTGELPRADRKALNVLLGPGVVGL